MIHEDWLTENKIYLIEFSLKIQRNMDIISPYTQIVDHFFYIIRMKEIASVKSVNPYYFSSYI